MAHSTLSLMIPPSLSTSTLLTCTPIRPSTRPSTGPLQISSSDEIDNCDDPINVSFGSLADLHSPTLRQATTARRACLPLAAPRPARQLVERGCPRSVHRSFPKIAPVVQFLNSSTQSSVICGRGTSTIGSSVRCSRSCRANPTSMIFSITEKQDLRNMFCFARCWILFVPPVRRWHTAHGSEVDLAHSHAPTGPKEHNINHKIFSTKMFGRSFLACQGSAITRSFM